MAVLTNGPEALPTSLVPGSLQQANLIGLLRAGGLPDPLVSVRFACFPTRCRPPAKASGPRACRAVAAAVGVARTRAAAYEQNTAGVRKRDVLGLTTVSMETGVVRSSSEGALGRPCREVRCSRTHTRRFARLSSVTRARSASVAVAGLTMSGSASHSIPPPTGRSWVLASDVSHHVTDLVASCCVHGQAVERQSGGHHSGLPRRSALASRRRHGCAPIRRA